MKRPTYEDVNGDVAKYLKLMNEYCDYLEKLCLTNKKEREK